MQLHQRSVNSQFRTVVAKAPSCGADVRLRLLCVRNRLQ
jgi:hypothetical protein